MLRFSADALYRLRVALCSAQGKVFLSTQQAVVLNRSTNSKAIEYNKRLQFSPSQLALFNRIFCRMKAEFDPHYVQKIRGEFEWSKFVARNTRSPTKAKDSSRQRRSKPASNTGVVSVVNEQTLEAISGLFLD